jgi:hypothetical protein
MLSFSLSGYIISVFCLAFIAERIRHSAEYPHQEWIVTDASVHTGNSGEMISVQIHIHFIVWDDDNGNGNEASLQFTYFSVLTIFTGNCGGSIGTKNQTSKVNPDNIAM